MLTQVNIDCDLRLNRVLGYTDWFTWRREGTLQESAIKARDHAKYYASELEAYRRLERGNIHVIRDLNVPQLLRCDDALRVIEMSIVRKPFLLDFAGATIDRRFEFSAAVWREWEAEKREQFGMRWPEVQKVISELECRCDAAKCVTFHPALVTDCVTGCFSEFVRKNANVTLCRIFGRGVTGTSRTANALRKRVARSMLLEWVSRNMTRKNN